MKPEKDELFSLIKSMSKSEKRYFKIGAKKSGETKSINYLKIFDALNDMEEYDEGKLRKKFKKEKFIDHLPSEKRYLYQAILKSLRQYRSENSAYAQIKEMILDAGYLQERGLYKQALKVLKKAKKQANLYEDLFAQLEINKKERQILRHLKNKGYEEQIEAFIQEKDIIIDAMITEMAYFDFFEKMSIKVVKNFKLRNAQQKQELQIELQKLVESMDYDKTARSKFYYHQVKHFYHQAVGEFADALFHCNEVVKWWESHPEIKQEQLHLYQVALSNLINLAFTQGQHDTVLPLIEKLEKETPQNAQEQSIIFQKVTQNRLLYYINHYKFEEALQMIPSVEEGLKKYQVAPNTRITIICNIYLLFFITAHYKRCDDWLEKLTKPENKNYRQDLQKLARIVNVMCHLDQQGDFEKIENLCRSAYRYCKQYETTKDDSKYELEVISYLRRFNNTPLMERKDILLQFQEYLIKENKSPENKTLPGIGEFQLWIESQLSKKSIATLLIEQKKAKE